MEEQGKSLVVMFAALSGKSRLHEKLNPVDAQDAAARCVACVEEAVAGHAGRVVKSIGDEVMAVFAEADDAFQAASAMQQRVGALVAPGGARPALRVGFASGALGIVGGELSGEATRLAAHLVGLAFSGQILTDCAARDALAPGRQAQLREIGLLAPGGPLVGKRVYMLAEGDSGDEPAAEKRTDGRRSRLCLRYGGEVYVIDDKVPRLSLGRDRECDVTIRDRRASRQHASIEWRGENFLLTDRSTNGTYLTLSGKPELHLKRDECMIYGKGTISFAGSLANDDPDFAEFEQL